MIKFWSYKRELKKYKKEIYRAIQKTLSSGQKQIKLAPDDCKAITTKLILGLKKYLQ